MTGRNRIALITLIVAAVAAAAIALAPRPIAVELGEVTRGVYEQTVSDDGRTRVRDRYVVSAPLAGRVERIRLKAGDPVAKGQVLAVLTPTAPGLLDARTSRELAERLGAAEADQQRARAEMARAAAQRDQARADLARQSRLAKEGFVSPAAKEQAELALRTAERAVEVATFGEDAAGHAFAQARAALTRYKSGDPAARWEVTAPVDGVVLRVAQESEGVVALGAPLLEIADPGALEVVVDVLSQDSVAIRPGMAARIEVGGATLGARVRRVEPAAFTKVSALGIEEQRVNVLLDFTDGAGKLSTLGDGFRVDAHIVVGRAEDAIRVPVGALFREGDNWAVFVAAGDRAKKRGVKVLRRNGQFAQVAEGLAPGERVVLYPSDALAEGLRIREAGARKGN